MKLGEIFGDALKYPISNPQSLIIVGVIFLIANLTTLLAQFGVRNSAFATIWAIVALIVSILLVGYGLSILKNAIDLGDDIPSFDWMNNFIDGIKVLVVQVVYMIVPTIVSIIVGYATMGPALSRIFTPANISQMATNSSSTSVILNSIPSSVWAGLFSGIAITAVITIIFYIIFALFSTVAQCRLAKYDSLGEAFSFGQVFSDMKEIGIINLFVFVIILWIIVIIIAMVGAFITAIPIVGIIISSLIINSFILLFSNRALGLLYSDV